MPAPRRDSLPPALRTIAQTSEYDVAVFRNVMVQHIRGAVDLAFLRASLAGHHAALEHSPEGYGVVTLVATSARIPGAQVRDEAGRLREKTQHMLKAQSVLIGADGFFASTMRAIITGIVTMAKSRVPLKMVGTEAEAASFVVERVLPRGTDPKALADALIALRAAG